MSTLQHKNKPIQTVKEDWQTQARGSNAAEYEIYLSFAKGADGLDFTTGQPLKTYDEWLNS